MVFVFAILLILVVAVGYAALITYPAMLLFGAVHSFLPAVPAFGFWQTLAVVILLRLLFSSGSSAVKSD